MIFPGFCCESNTIETQRENNLWTWECYRPESGFLDQRTRTSQTSNINAKNFSRKKVTWLFCQTSKGLYNIWPFLGGLTWGDTLKHFWIAFWILYRFSLAMSVMAKSLKVRTTSGRPVKSTLNWSLKIALPWVSPLLCWFPQDSSAEFLAESGFAAMAKASEKCLKSSFVGGCFVELKLYKWPSETKDITNFRKTPAPLDVFVGFDIGNSSFGSC